MLPNTPENMVRWLREPQAVNPRSAMPDLGVSEGDARDIAAFLSTIR
jgi:cytochrome c1